MIETLCPVVTDRSCATIIFGSTADALPIASQIAAMVGVDRSLAYTADETSHVAKQILCDMIAYRSPTANDPLPVRPPVWGDLHFWYHRGMLMFMTHISIPPLLEVSQYRGEWLALNPQNHEEVVAHDRSLRTATRMAKQRGVEQPILYAVPESDAYFVGRLVLAS